MQHGWENQKGTWPDRKAVFCLVLHIAHYQFIGVIIAAVNAGGKTVKRRRPYLSGANNYLAGQPAARPPDDLTQIKLVSPHDHGDHTCGGLPHAGYTCSSGSSELTSSTLVSLPRVTRKPFLGIYTKRPTKPLDSKLKQGYNPVPFCSSPLTKAISHPNLKKSV